MEEERLVRVSIAAHGAAAIAMGWISFMLSAAAGKYAVAGLGIAVLGFLGVALKRNGKNFKWWASNGLFIYLLVWLVSWIYFFNL